MENFLKHLGFIQIQGAKCYEYWFYREPYYMPCAILTLKEMVIDQENLNRLIFNRLEVCSKTNALDGDMGHFYLFTFLFCGGRAYFQVDFKYESDGFINRSIHVRFNYGDQEGKVTFQSFFDPKYVEDCTCYQHPGVLKNTEWKTT